MRALPVTSVTGKVKHLLWASVNNLQEACCNLQLWNIIIWQAYNLKSHGVKQVTDGHLLQTWAVCSLQCSLCMWEMQQTDGRAALSPPATLNMWTVLGGRKSIFSLDQGWDTVWTTLQNISNISCQNNSKQAGSLECLKQQVDVVCIYGNKSGLDDPWMNRHFSRVESCTYNVRRRDFLSWNSIYFKSVYSTGELRSKTVMIQLWYLDFNLLINLLIKWSENKPPHKTGKIIL